MKLLLATHNNHKKEEFKSLLPPNIELFSLEDVNINDEIQETGITFQENAKIKSDFGFNKTGIPCFADDSGLVIPSLNGEPGIYSARYSPSGNSDDNIQKVLEKMQSINDRNAYFICVISYSDSSGNYLFEGKIDGEIQKKITKKNGFGYDPIFKPNGYSITFAEMEQSEKNKISHRGIAFEKFKKFLEQNNK